MEITTEYILQKCQEVISKHEKKSRQMRQIWKTIAIISRCFTLLQYSAEIA